MNYRSRLIYLMLLDSIIVFTSIYISNFILIPTSWTITKNIIVSSITLFLAHHLFAYRYKLYKRAWEYASIGELVAILKAVTISILIIASAQKIILDDIALRTLAITWMMHVILIGGSRFIWRLLRDNYIQSKIYMKRALIIGAGATGTMVNRQLKQNKSTDLYPVAFVDDNLNKHNLEIIGTPVLGRIKDIEQIVKDNKIDHIIIAIPSLNRKDLNRIYRECAKTAAKTQIIPKMEDLILGNVSVSEFRDVQVEDLLGRNPIPLDINNISDYIEGKTVLVTGAGGSIGSEICRQVCHFNPKQIILLGHGENSIYSIELELKEITHGSIELIAEIADIQDKEKIFQVVKKHSPYVIFHASAHKHVPLMENNPDEAVKNNIIGTKNIADAANHYKVNTFVMISTDKAVNPTSVMGATKRIAEMVIQHMAKMSTTKFVAVRFGNVLGSSGSVIPLFKDQIKKGGPVTVTHPDMIRYFMTIPEASRLVIQAGALAKGGEIFVLDMGEPIKILELARNLIKLSGFTEEDIEIKFTGIRPGEKLFEEVLTKDEIQDKQIYHNIYIGKSLEFDFEVIENLLNEFRGLEMDALKKELLEIANHKKKILKSFPIAQ